ncbi:MAG: winged helix-turn-helix domain-containing protein [Anaerostipes sp.]|nr:winged helix-turn-helix domain-containing protein [Anaerostipes sp.]
MKIHKSHRKVYFDEKEIKLTYTEFEILYLLAKNPGCVFSKEQIYESIWDEPSIGDSSIVMSHIQKIRKKIGDNSSNPTYIQTVWGVRYRFNKEISSNL